MACTAALSFYSTSPPARSPCSGNVVITNGGGSPVHVTAVQVVMANTRGLTQVDVNFPPVGPYAGAAGGGITIAAAGTLSVPFSFVAVGGTIDALVSVDDGSNPTATATITPN